MRTLSMNRIRPGQWFPGLVLALVAGFTITGCALDSESTAPNPADEEVATQTAALGVGCTASLDCSIDALEAAGYAIAECMLDDGFCQDMDDGTSGCVGAVNLTCAQDLTGIGEEIACNDGIDNDGDGDTDGDDPNCNGRYCELEEPATCMSTGMWENGVCVPQNDEAGTWCAYDDVCKVASYCDGDGACEPDESSSICCSFTYECPECPSGSARTCSEPFLEADFGLCGCTPVDVEVCFNGIDDNGDGVRDCDDSACADLPHCNSEQPCCSTNLDAPGCEDTVGVMDVCLGMGDTWCCEVNWDSICVWEYNMLSATDETPGVCEAPEVCSDGIDNDLDWLADCFDPDCEGSPSCVEICDNGVDDGDTDSLTDCEDLECADHPSCAPICGEDLSCDDPSCSEDPACTPDPVEECSNDIDDDADGLADCADPDCPPCEEEPTEVTLQLNAGWYFQGCTGSSLLAPFFVSCSGGWNSNAGQSLSWDPATENALFTIRNEGGLWPLQAVDCATDEFTLVGATPSDIFVDPTDPASLGCTPVCTDPDGDGTPSAPNWVCTGVPAP